MPSKKGQGGAAWQVILEDIQSQNRATIEALSATRVEIKQDIAELATETRSRLAVLEIAIARLSRDTAERDATLEQAIRTLRSDTEVALRDVRVDLRSLSEKVEALGQLEERVATLEKHRPN